MKRILDACCGSKMFWFDKENPDVEFVDIREVDNEKIWESKDGAQKRFITVKPTTIADFTNLPFPDESFYHVVFDPPHLVKIGERSWMSKKCGKLPEEWEAMLRDGFSECFRVLKPNGTLIFKWSERDIPLNKILGLTEHKPLYGHKSGKQNYTHWVAFIKDGKEEKNDRT